MTISYEMTFKYGQNGPFVVAPTNDSISSIWVLGNNPHADYPSIFLALSL